MQENRDNFVDLTGVPSDDEEMVDEEIICWTAPARSGANHKRKDDDWSVQEDPLVRWTKRTRAAAALSPLQYAIREPPRPVRAANPSGDRWKVVLCMDFQEHNGTRKKEAIMEQINGHFRGTNPVDHVYGTYCEIGNSVAGTQKLPVGDYMFVARKVNSTGKVLEEKVLNVLIERKSTENVMVSIQKESRRHRPLKEIEVQLRQMQYCGIDHRIFLLEGDEDRSGLDTQQRKAVKTFRMYLNTGEFGGVQELVCTETHEDTVAYLIEMLQLMTSRFARDPHNSVSPASSFGNVKEAVKRAMHDRSFLEYKEQRAKPGIGDKRAVQELRKRGYHDFVSPCIRRNTKADYPNERARMYFRRRRIGY